MELARQRDTIFQADTGIAYVGVRVRAYVGLVEQQLYSDSEGTTTDLVETNSNGLYEFWIEQGDYTLEFSVDGQVLGEDDYEVWSAARSADLASTATGKGAALVGFSQAPTYAEGTTGKKLQETIALADYVTAANATDPAAVYDGISEAISTAASRGIRKIIMDARIYAQPDADITLNNVTIIAASLARPPYMSGNFATTIQQTDQTRPIFRLGKNVTLVGLNMLNPAITDAAAQAAITAAGAVTSAQKKAALEGVWGASSPMLIGQAGDSMSTINLIDICVPKCWYFMRMGNTPAYEVAGSINLVRPRVFAVARDFVGKSSAELNNVVDGFFSFGVSPDEFAAPASSPLRDYAVDYGAFLEVASAESDYASFDGFNVDNTVIFGKKFGCLASSGALTVSRWRGVHVDAVSHAIYIQPAGRILHTSFDIDAYSYRFPSADPDADAASRTVIYAGPTAAASTGYSRFSVKLKSDYSAGPALIVAGDRECVIDFDGFQAYDFGAKDAAGIAAVNVGNANAIVRLPDAHFKALTGNTVHSGISVSAGRVEAVGPKFETCKYSAAITGGTLVLDHPTSIATVTQDLIQSGGTLDVRDPRWSNPGSLAGYPSFRVFGDAQTFTGAATVKTFPTESFDQHGDFASNTFTTPLTGQYQFTFQCLHDSTGTAGDRWQIAICKNGTAAAAISYKMIADYNSVGLTTTLPCNAGETVDVRVTRVGGAGNFVVFADNTSNFFVGRKVA